MVSATLPRIIDRFARRTVLVIGEAMLDSYLDGTTGRLCREAPVPVVDVQARVDAPGGAANTAVNVHALGGRVHFLSVVGDDLEGRILRGALDAAGVSTEHMLTQPGRRTIAKHRVTAGGHMLVRFDQGSTEPVSPEIEQRLIDRLGLLVPRCHAIVVSDYGYGVLTPSIIAAIARLQANRHRVLVADAKDLRAYRAVHVTAVKPNYEEVRALLGLAVAAPGERVAQLAEAGPGLLRLTGAQIAAVTLDTDGGLVFEHGRPPYRLYAQPRPHSNAAGAGDTFVSALALALAAQAPTPAAAELAAAAAAVAVSREGTAACAADDLRAHVLSERQWIPDRARLTERLALQRRRGQRVVFTNGCFDLLHRGHIAFLNQAKALGDILVVGVNSDASVRRLKGPSRPINPLDDRVQVLAALSCVDYITAFDEDDAPDALIRAVRPDVFVKGGNYTRAALPEAALVEQLGGQVHILPYHEEHSTSGIIRRISEAGGGPARRRRASGPTSVTSAARVGLPADGVGDAAASGAA